MKKAGPIHLMQRRQPPHCTVGDVPGPIDSGEERKKEKRLKDEIGVGVPMTRMRVRQMQAVLSEMEEEACGVNSGTGNGTTEQ